MTTAIRERLAKWLYDAVNRTNPVQRKQQRVRDTAARISAAKGDHRKWLPSPLPANFGTRPEGW